jgi:hypothetical protein
MTTVERARVPITGFVADNPRADWTFELPIWLVMSSAAVTNNRTSFIARFNVAGPGGGFGGFGANAARARNFGQGYGLSVESARTNHISASLPSDPGGWVATDLAPIVPAGYGSGIGERKLTDTSVLAVGEIRTSGVTVPLATQMILSGLFQNLNGENETKFMTMEGIKQPGAVVLTTLTKFWPYVGWDMLEAPTFVSDGASATMDVVIKPAAAAPADLFGVTAAGIQLEEGKYPTSRIFRQSFDPDITRTAETLSITAPSLVAPGGFFDVDFTWAPNYATAEFVADHNLIFFDAANRIFLRQADKKIVMRIGGVDIASSALTWSRNQPIRVEAHHKTTGRRLYITGASSGNGETTAGAVAAIGLPLAIYVLCDAAGAVECADLQRLLWFNPAIT